MGLWRAAGSGKSANVSLLGEQSGVASRIYPKSAVNRVLVVQRLSGHPKPARETPGR
jgi:hypothetical protein